MALGPIFSLPSRQRDALLEETFAYADWLRTSGHLIEDHGLLGAATATTLRFESGKMLITDGPFAETKEWIAGFDVIECASLDEATDVAAKHPMARLGRIEVRPFWLPQ